MILMLYPLIIICIPSLFDDCVPVEPAVMLLSTDNDTVADAETVRGNQVSSPFAQMNVLPCSTSENVSSSISVPSSSV